MLNITPEAKEAMENNGIQERNSLVITVNVIIIAKIENNIRIIFLLKGLFFSMTKNRIV